MPPHVFSATAQAQIHFHTAQAQPAEAPMPAALLQEATMTPVQTTIIVTDHVTIMHPTAMLIETKSRLMRVRVNTVAAHIPL